MKFVSVYDSVEYESRKPLKKYRKLLAKINARTDHYRSMTDDELVAASLPYREHFDVGNKNHIVEVFAIAREVTYRLLGKFQYDVQVIGALACMDRNIIQMSTGSGKTITLILPAVAFGLTRKGVNVLTVNDYLSKRDWEETRPVYDWFGVSNAYVNNDMGDQEQRDGFACDITYSTNSSLGFAYLNSCLANDLAGDPKIITRPLHAAIIDEVDEILMDDARNPLIISAEDPDSEDRLDFVEYDGRKMPVQEIVDGLKTLQNMYFDEEDSTSLLDDRSLDEIMEMFDFDDRIFSDTKMMHVIYNGVQAIFKNKRFVDYIVQEEPDEMNGSRVVLIDKATGRLARGRTMSNNLHAFVEMKEGVYTGAHTTSSIQITYQVLFNLFETIAGVTGTTGTSFVEFIDIYQTGVVVIPDRLPNRLQQSTHIYMTQAHLMSDLVKKTRLYMSAHRPVLIGGSSDIEADMISDTLRMNGIPHRLLLSTDEDEDAVVESAGRPGSVVVTTDIMGRGTDIHVEDVDMERGLVVLQVGSRPNSRVERQFAGRAGRQGQPGRYHRMLSVPELKDIGVTDESIGDMLHVYRKNKQIVEDYGGDILLDGKNVDYEAIVEMVDYAMTATESAASSHRVEEFKTYSIVDLIQVSLISQMDDHRRVLRHVQETNELSDIRDRILELSFGDAKVDKRLLRERYDIVKSWDVVKLANTLYDYINHIVDDVIPEFRDYCDSAISTVRMSQQVKYDVPPETHMIKHVQTFLAEHADDFVLKIE